LFFGVKPTAVLEAAAVSKNQPLLPFMPQDPSEREELVTRWTVLVQEILPSMAKCHQWPMTEDHCFMRICLDGALGAPWHTIVRRPAIRHLSDQQLSEAIAVAESVIRSPPILDELNRQSISWRKRR
jgi:hypothetical protein